jgi:hypothetical protein
MVISGAAGNPAFSQDIEFSSERRHMIDSLKKAQWAIWDQEEAAREEERRKWMEERSLQEKDPLYKKIILRTYPAPPEN